MSGEIHKDVLVLKNVFLPLMRATGNLPINDIDISHYIDALESFEQEGNLSIELDHTKTQGRVLADLSRTKSYSVPVPETLDLGNHIQGIPLKFKVPEIAEHISSPDALVMELVNGCTLDRDAAIARLFDQWKPDWSGGERLGIDSFEVENIMKELRTLLVKVYVEAARKSGFINSDFQEGNFMLKLESDHIGIYFIDHGNCISVDNFDQAAQSLLCDSLVTDLFLFFHQRYHENDKPLSVSEFSELCQTDSVMDSVIYPLTDDYLQDNKKFINDWRKIFASKQDSEFTLRRYSPGMKIRGICSDIYQLFQLRWTSSPETGQSISEEDFFQGLINLLSKAVLKNKQIDDTNKKQVCSDVVHSFDDYLYEKGFHSPGNALLMRVFMQIQAYNQRTRDDY
ncbi:AarF/UbiB family protein [Endozoicomonas sp. ONNA2]|uniref:AarF/UbiB family protein n=1 Tax=Endozoicomonas sp. ONNA2 TaxID=2828741 RepID=UPI0021483A43|nr:AarF/UbiB family protein [Endozoicomonas sp. ONNA2]